MKKNYLFVLLSLIFTNAVFAQTVLFEQVVDGTSGIISDFLTDTSLGTYSSDDFILTESSDIEEVFVEGFNNSGDTATLMSSLDVFIYADNAGMPNSDPTQTGTGLLELTGLTISDAFVTIVDNNITIDITAANGGTIFNLPAGTYWLVVAPHAPLADRWNWFASSPGGNAMIFDEGNFGAAIDWTLFTGLSLTFDSLAFRITGTELLSTQNNNLSELNIYPNPTSNTLFIENSNFKFEEIEIYDTFGKRVYSDKFSQEINVSALNSGIYISKLKTSDATLNKKFIKL
jgi:hypothetical protein